MPESAKALVRKTRSRSRRALVRVVPGLWDSRVAWVFGSPRSGSTWLLMMLAEHPRVVPINEPLIGSYLGPFLSDTNGFDPRHLGVDDFSVRRVKHRTRDEFFAARFSDVSVPALGRMMRARFAAHVIRTRGGSLRDSIVAVKEPSGSQSADLLAAAMPRSRIVFLLRDGRDVVDSELAARATGSWVGRNFPGATGIGSEDRLGEAVAAAHRWLCRTEVVEEAIAAHPGPTLVVRYEELRADPVAVLGRVFSFLGIPPSRPELQGWVGAHEFERLPSEQRGPQQFFRSAAPGAWRENLSDREIEAVEDLIGAKLRALGYPE